LIAISANDQPVDDAVYENVYEELELPEVQLALVPTQLATPTNPLTADPVLAI
jgi:hypothetical protein